MSKEFAPTSAWGKFWIFMCIVFTFRWSSWMGHGVRFLCCLWRDSERDWRE